MRLRALRPAVAAAALVASIVAGATLTPSAGNATAATRHLARFGQTTTVGALFSTSASGGLQSHFCTGSVVDSPGGDLVVTAAHCVQDQRVGQIVFVPDYSSGSAPFGVWTVTRVVVDKQWQQSTDPDDDFAFLTVTQIGSRVPIEDLTGGELLGIRQSAGRPVKVAGYPDTEDTLLSCENTVTAFSATQFEFDCGGFTDGTSGSPLLAAAIPAGTAGKIGSDPVDMVIGVIGGYERGGDTASVSYAAKFSSRLASLYKEAVAVSAD